MYASEGVYHWTLPRYDSLCKKTVMRRKKNSTRRGLLTNFMPSSTDPDLSSSTSSLRSSISRSSSWNFTFECEQSILPASPQPVTKIGQLVKVNEAIAIELAHLESNKERWLEKLKLLEARICSNIVNIEKWATENSSNPFIIQAVALDTEAVDKLEEGSVSDVHLAWRLSLSDLASIFKRSSSELSNRSSSHPQTVCDTAISGPNFDFEGYEYACTLDTRYDGNDVEGVLSGNDADRISLSSPKETKMSGKGTKLAIPTVAETANDVNEILSADSADLMFSSSANDTNMSGKDSKLAMPTVAASGRGETPCLKIANDDTNGDHADVELFRPVPSKGSSSLRRASKRDKVEDRLASNGSHDLPTDLELMSKANLVDEMLNDSWGIEEVSSEKQGSARKTNDITTLNQAKKQLQQLEQHLAATRREKADMESTLRECQFLLEDSRLDVNKLTSQNEELKGMLAECRASLESAQLDLMKEKDEKEHKLLISMRSLEELQQNIRVLERQKLVLDSELNHFRHAFEKEKDKVVRLKRDKAAFELDLSGCKQMLKEAQDNSVLLKRESNAVAGELRQIKGSLAESQQQCATLERANVELQDSLSESKHGFEKVVEDYSALEEEKKKLEAAQKDLVLGLEKTEQHCLMLKNENEMLENLLAELKLNLERAQQQVVMLEEDRNHLKSQLTRCEQAFDEGRQHAISLEKEKAALELRSCKYEQVIQETQQYVVTLQNALEGTLQRADALDHQLQRSQMETKRLLENNEKVQALKHDLETKIRDLETQKESLQSSLENLKSKLVVTEETLTKVNLEYLLAIESREEERVRTRELQDQQLLLEKDNSRLRCSLEATKQHLKLLETEQEMLQMKLEDAEGCLGNAMQELDALSADHMNEVAALRIENAAIDFKTQELSELLQCKTMELERLGLVEANLNNLTEELNSQREKVMSTTAELDSVKMDLSGRLNELQSERSAKATIMQELDASLMKLKKLEEELSRVRAEQAALRKSMMDEMTKKKDLMQRLKTEQAHKKELEIAFELKQNDLLVQYEEETMAKEAVIEEIEAIKGYSEELENDLHKLQVQVQIMGQNNHNENLILAERSRCKELEELLDLRIAEQEDISVALEGERHANEVLCKQLEEEQSQMKWLQEQLKMSKVNEEQAMAALLEEKAERQSLKECLNSLEAKYNKELEAATNSSEIDQQRTDCETVLKSPIMQEIYDQGKAYSEQKPIADIESSHAETQKIMSLVAEIFAKSKNLVQAVSKAEKESDWSSSKDVMWSALLQEVNVLQSLLQGKQPTMAGVEEEHVTKSDEEEEVKQNEDELVALLKESSAFGGVRVTTLLEDHIGRCSSDSWVMKKPEELEFEHKLKDESVHHTAAIADVAALLAELESLKRLLLSDNTILASDKKEQKKKSTLSMPTAALSTTSVLAALGLLALLKSPKLNNNS